jgi:transposase
VLSIDEFRGNAGGERFQCILTAPEDKRIVDILPDRSICSIQDYLKRFPNREEVAYFVMDMNRGYRDIAQSFFPKAKIVIDRFHYVRYGVWAFENVRKRVQKSLNPQQRKYFKRSRKLLQARASRLSTEDRQAVEIMLSHSEDLTRAWLLKEEFFKFVDAKSSAEAKTALDSFRYYAKRIHLPEFRECLRMLNNWEEYILNSFDCPFSNGFTEGINNSIKVLKRVTFGMPNFQNFRARILHCNSFYP